MDTRKLSLLAAALLTTLLLAACTLPFVTQQPVNDNPIIDPTPVPEEPDAEEEYVDFPGREVCDELSPHFALYYPWTISITPQTYEVEPSGLGGDGCQVLGAGTGEVITDWRETINLTFDGIKTAGWTSDLAFEAASAGQQMSIFRKDGTVCRLFSEVRAGSPELCAVVDGWAECMEKMTPAETIYELTADCTPDSYTADEPVEIPPLVTERVEFNPGAISVYLNGSMEHSHSKTYVLRVLEKQDMLIKLTTNPPLGGLITLFAESGQVFLSDHGDSMEFMGTMPASQDYYITVSAGPEEAIDYNLKVLIPPLGEALVRDWTSLEYDECNALATQIGQIMAVPAYVTSSIFEDHLTRTVGGSCLISAWGNQVEIPDWIGTTNAVTAWIEAAGWVQDNAYDAGGATGISTAYRMGNKMCIYTQSISAQSRALCPTDQPISTCLSSLPPEQVIYSVELNCAISN